MSLKPNDFTGACAAAFGASLLAMLVGLLLPATDSATLGLSAYHTWAPLTSFTSNLFIAWREPLSPVSLAPLPELNPSWRTNLLLGWNYWILAFGAFLLLRTLKVTPRIALLATLFTGPLPSLLLGRELLYSSAFAWLPLFTWSVLSSSTTSDFRVRRNLLSVCIGLMLIFSAHHLALVTLSSGYLLAMALQRSALDARNGATVHHDILSTACLLTLLVVALVLAFQIPLPPYPEYPRFARVVPGYGTSIGVDPLIGPSLPITSIDRSTLRHWSLVLGSLLMLGSIVLYLLERHSKRSPGPIILSLVCAGSLLWDSMLLSPSSNAIGPLASLGRLLPSAIGIPLGPSVAFIGMFSLLLSVLLVSSSRPLVCSLITLLAPIAIAGTLATPEGFHLDQRVRSEISEQGDLVRILLSPSAAVLRREGLDKMKLYSSGPTKRWISAGDRLLRSLSSHNQSDLALAIDYDPKTRWSTEIGSQRGDEWIYFEFDTAMQISGVSFGTENFPSDFPRGVRLSTSDVCEGAPHGAPWTRVVDEPEWHGSLKFTSSGLPYYDAQSVVELSFPGRRVRCLLISQTGREPVFEWSVTEVRLGVDS